MINLEIQIACIPVQSQKTKQELQFYLHDAIEIKSPQDNAPYSKQLIRIIL